MVVGGLALALVVAAGVAAVVIAFGQDDSGPVAAGGTSAATTVAAGSTPTGTAVTATATAASPTAAGPSPSPTPSPTPTPSRTPAPTPIITTPDRGPFAAADQVIQPGRRYTATISTDRGVIVVRLFADLAPRTVNSLAFLAGRHYFDDTTFHRIVSGAFVQGGDPWAGEGGPGYYTQEEPTSLKNVRGMVVMAKDGLETRFGSQFLIHLRDNPPMDADSPNWRQYYPFGQVISGMDVVDAIGQAAAGADERPLQPVRILTLRVVEE